MNKFKIIKICIAKVDYTIIAENNHKIYKENNHLFNKKENRLLKKISLKMNHKTWLFIFNLIVSNNLFKDLSHNLVWS